MKNLKKYIQIRRGEAILSLSVVLVTIIIDYVTKILVSTNMTIGQSIPLIKNVLHLTYITNKGAAFGSFANHRWVFLIATFIFLIIMSVVIICWTDHNKAFYISLSMIIGGGIGNMIDRIAYGKVIDFIDFCAFPNLWMWIFNGADSFVCVGAFLFGIYFIMSEVKNEKQEKEKEDLND